MSSICFKHLLYSEFHRSSVAWGPYKISGCNFHNFNESKQPWHKYTVWCGQQFHEWWLRLFIVLCGERLPQRSFLGRGVGFTLCGIVFYILPDMHTVVCTWMLNLCHFTTSKSQLHSSKFTITITPHAKNVHELICDTQSSCGCAKLHVTVLLKDPVRPTFVTHYHHKQITQFIATPTP